MTLALHYSRFGRIHAANRDVRLDSKKQEVGQVPSFWHRERAGTRFELLKIFGHENLLICDEIIVFSPLP
jgi:hypothetical protein